MITTIELSSSEVSTLLDKDPSVIRKSCVNGRYNGAHQENGQWKIPLSSLGLGPVKEFEYLKKRGLVDVEITESKKDVESTIVQLDTLQGFRRNVALWRKFVIDELNKIPRSEWPHAINRLSTMPDGELFSIPTAYRWKADYKKYGLIGLAPKWGQSSKGTTSVPEAAGDLFDSLALQESAPSFADIYMVVVGYMKKMYPEMQLPHLASFKRRFDMKYPKHVQDFARKGYRYYQRHHEYYIPRTVEGIASGKGWFSDHHQLDTIVLMPDGSQVRPWITVWRDIRSGKMLSCFFHDAAPNSDHIFYAFYLAAEKYGLPDFIYIDNGKDYRSYDFAGVPGRYQVWNEQNEICARSLMGLLMVEVVFATPYNAQAKTVERDFQKIINQFAKFMLAYTGMNSSKRPETTIKQCKHGELLTYEECGRLLDKYINEVFNKKPSFGKNNAGLSPDDAFEKYRTTIKTVSQDSLKLCLMRTSQELTIGRNGINMSEIGVSLRYWAEWMFPLKGTKVYMRRDIQKYQTAWVWQADNNAFLGKAVLADAIDIKAIGDVKRAELQTEIRRKRADLRNVKEAAQRKIVINGSEIIEAMATAQPEPTVPVKQHPKQIILTQLDTAIAEDERMQKTGTYDVSSFAPLKKEKPALISEFGPY